MQSTSAANQKFNGPASNAINHDYDQIILYMGVRMPVLVDYLGNVTWALDFSQVASSGHPASGFFAVVGCLNPNSALYNSADCVAQQNLLAGWNVTPDVFPDILAADPFWDPNNQPTTIDPNRYKPAQPLASVNYAPNQANPTIQVQDTNNLTSTNSVTVSDSHSVSFSVFGSFGAKLNNSNKVTFTNESTTVNKTGTTDSSTFVISMPTAPDSEPGSLSIYVDTIYKTFMFSFIPPPPQ